MSISFNLYPVLSQEQISEAVKTPGDLTFFYYENGLEQYLHLENKSDNEYNYTAELRDAKCAWYPETHDLYLKRRLCIDDPSHWFGQEGIVPESGVLGIAEQWISVKSEIRGFIPLGELRSGDKDVHLSVEHKFPRNLIKGSLLLKTVVYLKESGNPRDGEKHLCNQSGTILGEICNCEIFVDGNGSIFPIATINDPQKPLWMVYFDDTADPLQDAFDQEHVEIRLNRAHPCYDQLRIESSLKESPLFLEVISSSLMIIIDSAKELLGPDWENVISGQIQFQRGSIAEAVQYFIVKLGWDISSPSKLAQSIHSFFDTSLQGGAI